ncbi:MAG: DUF1835 domain-containing protein [Bacteroidota bacterium]
MADKTLHITNGDSLTQRLLQHNNFEKVISWREILCEGPATHHVFSEEFIFTRIQYLKNEYEGTEDRYLDFVKQYQPMDYKEFDGIVLWFEYDLFCHVNLAAVVAFLRQHDHNLPVYWVCSGAIEGSDRLFGLSELSHEQLNKHYLDKRNLNDKELEVLSNFWTLYTAEDHRPLSDLDFSEETFPYLTHSIQAHLKRFPAETNGLNELEKRVLEAIDEELFSNTRQLLAYLLRNQGYYGFGDMQWSAVIQRLDRFFDQDQGLSLTSEGKDILKGRKTAWEVLKDATQFGGSSKYEYFYDSISNNLKPVS